MVGQLMDGKLLPPAAPLENLESLVAVAAANLARAVHHQTIRTGMDTGCGCLIHPAPLASLVRADLREARVPAVRMNLLGEAHPAGLADGALRAVHRLESLASLEALDHLREARVPAVRMDLLGDLLLHGTEVGANPILVAPLVSLASLEDLDHPREAKDPALKILPSPGLADGDTLAGDPPAHRLLESLASLVDPRDLNHLAAMM